MRKFTLFLSLLFTTVMTTFAQDFADGVYKIYWDYNDRGYMAYHADYPTEAKLADVVLSGYQDIHFKSATDPVSLNWYLVTATDSKRYLFNVETGLFLGASTEAADEAVANALSESVALPITIESNTTSDYTIFAEINGQRYFLSSGCGQASTTGHPVRWNNKMADLSDGGTPLKLVPVADVTVDEAIMAAVKAVIDPVVNPEYTATVSVNDETMGTATVEVVDGVATFTATANEGYKFVTWMLESDGELMDSGNTTNPLSLPLDADYALQAKFEAEAVVEPAARELFDKAYAAAADILATVQTEVTKSEVALTTEAGQPGYVSSPHDHAVINPTSQWDMGGIAALIDGTKLHFHTAWENVPAGPHYFQVDMGEGESIEAFVFETLNRDDAGYDFPSEFTIKGSNDDVDYELISVVDASASAANGATFESNVITASKPYRYLRFEVTNCISTGDNNQTGYRTYFHIAEFDLFKAEVKVSEQYADLKRAYDAAANNADADDATLEEYTKALNAGIHFVTAYEWVGEYKVQANVTDLTTDWTTPSPLSFEVATKFQSWKNATDIILKSFAGVDLSQASGGAYPTITVSEDGKNATIPANTTLYLASELLWGEGGIWSKSTVLRPVDSANGLVLAVDDNGVVSVPNLEIVNDELADDYTTHTYTTLATLTDVYAGKEGVQLPGVPAELTVEKVTPDAPVASLETIEIHFSDVTTTKVPNTTMLKGPDGMGYMFMSREIDGKVQRLTLMPAITTPGTYTLTIAADKVQNEAGVFYAGGTFEFIVEKPLVVTATSNDEALGTAAVVLEGNIASFSASPAAGSALVNWTVNGEEVTRELRFAAEVSEDVEVVANFVADPYQHITGNSTNGNRRWDSFTITNEVDSLEIKDIQKTNQSNMYAYRVDHVLEVKAGDVIYFSDFYFAGEWTHAYAYIDYNNDKVFGTDLNPYGETEGELVSFNYLEGVDSFGGQSSAQYAMSNSYDDSKGLPGFILPEGIAPGEYRMRIKTDWNSTDPNGDASIRTNGGCQCDFTIKVVGDEPVTPPVEETYLEIVSVTPTDGSTVEKLHYILLDMGVWCEMNAQGVDVTDADGNKVGYAEFTWKKEDGSQCTETQLVLKLQEAITAAGTYTIVLPENSIWDYEYGIKETTLTFTVAPATGIDGVDAEVEQVIYDITGRRIEKITNAGVYIVNGVKVLVK